MVAGADPVELVEALCIGDAEEPWTRRVVEGDGRVHRLGELAVLRVGVLVNRNGDAPVEEELFVEERNRRRRLVNGLEVVVRVVVVEHGDVGERPVGVHGVLKVGVVTGYAELEVSVGNAERIHHADVHRAMTGCIRDGRSDGVVEDVLLGGECQLEVHRAVALAF